jgi:Protein of unknown function (DUF2852)
MPMTARIDEFGKPAWIVLMILGFWFWWPLGLVTLAFMIGSGRMGCWNHHGHWQNKMDRMQEKMDRVRAKMDGARGDWWGTPPSSGNRAFDEYRTETLRRLEDEQKEFRDFLDRLRVAKDKTEFDAFMAERRNRVQDPGQTGAQPQG